MMDDQRQILSDMGEAILVALTTVSQAAQRSYDHACQSF